MAMEPQVRKWLEWVKVTSIPLRRLSSTGVITDIASGCLADYQGKRFLLTVAHAADETSSDWMLDLGYDIGKGTEFYRPHGFARLAEITCSSGAIRLIDFSFAEVPLDLVSIYQEVTPRCISEEQPRHVLALDFSSLTKSDQIYGFSGQVRPEFHGSTNLVVEMAIYPGLRYLRTEDEFDIFQLPVEHPGHEAFNGCSGAPIVDMHERVVALVTDGCTATNTIRGISLARFKTAFDAYIAGVLTYGG